MNNESTHHTLQISLLENGIDFILKGIDELFDNDFELDGYTNALEVPPASYKYGILHLFSGFLLLLKERLHRHIPELIFTGKLSEVRQKLRSNKAPHTVDLDEALERLEIGPQVVFSESETKVIRKMQAFRNQFEHYQVAVNKYELWSTISSFLALTDKFLVQHLNINIETSTRNGRLIGKIRQIESIWHRIEDQKAEAWMEEVARKLRKFRAHRDEILDDLRVARQRAKGLYEIFVTCPECRNETLIMIGEYAGVCSDEDCEYISPVNKCNSCGITTIGEPGDVTYCTDCQEQILGDLKHRS